MRKLQNGKTHALDLTEDQLAAVAELASQNLLLKDIALELGIDYRSFLKSWRDKNSAVYLAHRRGVAHMELSKEEVLKDLMLGGNITAYQIYEDKEQVRQLSDIKSEIFGI